MHTIHKIGLLLFNEDHTKFLVCEKFGLPYALMPGGKIEAGESDTDCLVREIAEELSVALDPRSLKFIGDYSDVTADNPDNIIHTKLYTGVIEGTPKPTSEIEKIYWIGVSDLDNPRLSPIIRNTMIPDLLKRGLLK